MAGELTIGSQAVKTGFTLRIPSEINLTDEQFFELCQANHDLRLERTAQGDIIVMPPTGGMTGNRNHEINRQLGNWTRQDGTGAAFDSSTGFRLPNGATASPDASWVARARLADLTPEQKQRFLPLCPDFVIELRSPTDSLAEGQAKLEEYIENGARLGWLIDPHTRRVYVYRPGATLAVVAGARQIAGDPELPGFVLALQEIWEPNL